MTIEMLKPHEKSRTMKRMKDSKTTESRPKRNDLRRFITVDATFGSEFQRTVAMRALREFMGSWKDVVESRHQRNTINIAYGDGSVPTEGPVRETR